MKTFNPKYEPKILISYENKGDSQVCTMLGIGMNTTSNLQNLTQKEDYMMKNRQCSILVSGLCSHSNWPKKLQ
jgi:hypothetical protein